jgi:uncharacterized membrane protein YfcA
MDAMTMDFWLGFGAALAAAGFGAGFLGGLFGGGGGMIVIPVLYHTFGALGVDSAVRMHLVVGTSLASVVPLSIMGARAHWRQGNVDLALLKPLVPTALAGSLVAGFIGNRLDAGPLAWVFAAVVLMLTLNILLRPRQQTLRLGAPTMGLVGAGIGCVSALVGIGGATLTVPVLNLLGATMRKAIGTAATLGMVIALPGAASFALAGAHADHLPSGSVGYVNLFAAAALFLCGSFGIAVGSRLTKKVDETLLRRLFAVLLIASAVRMVWATA